MSATTSTSVPEDSAAASNGHSSTVEIAAESAGPAPLATPPVPPPPPGAPPAPPPMEIGMMRHLAVRLGQTRGSAVLIMHAELTSGTRHFDEALKIGEGGFGAVWKADPLQSLGRGSFAVKRLHCEPSRALHVLSQLQGEIELLGRCAHPCLMPVLAYSVHPAAPCLVYPLAHGGNFEDRLLRTEGGLERLTLLGCDNHSALPWYTRCRVLRDTLRALTHLHALTPQVLHRDVKPSNILLGARGNALLADVGMAKVATAVQQSHCSTTAVRGTPGFVGKHDHRTQNSIETCRRARMHALTVCLLPARGCL